MSTAKPTRLEHILAALILIAAGLQLLISCYYAWGFTTDDAFISWRYARHLAEGHGFHWNNAGVAVEGYSNFAWVILASLFFKLGLPIALSVKSFACLSLATALVFLYQLSRTFLSLLPATLPVFLFSHYNGVVWWTVSGLETSLYIALALFVTWQSVRAMGFVKGGKKPNPLIYNSGAWIYACLGLTLLSLTRFDGIVWAIIIAAFISCSIYRSAEFKFQYPSLISLFIIFFALPYVAYFVWRMYYFEQFLPNSYACKALANGYMFQLIIDYLPLAFPCIVLGLPYFFSSKDCRHILLWLPSLLYTLLLYHADPVIAYYNRLFLAAFSVLTLLPVLGIQEFFSYFHFHARNNAIASTLVILLFTYIFIPGNQINTIKTAVEHYQQRSNMRLQIAQQLNRDAPFGARILLADCGVIPFFARSDLMFIDSLCLNNKDMTRKIWRSIPLYAKYIQSVIKPEWVIDTYYPKLHHGNILNRELRKMGFYNKYTLLTTYQSQRFAYVKGKPTVQEVDFVYRLYTQNGIAQKE